MPQKAEFAIRQEPASIMAESEQNKRLFLAGLNASETVPLHGVDDRPMCSVCARQELSGQALLGLPAQTVAFTGYRPPKLPDSCSPSVQTRLSCLLVDAIRDSYAKGCRIYLNGMMAGWDVLAAEAVLTVRSDLADICCVSVAPFRKSYFANSNWTPDWKARALNVYRQSDHAFYLSEQYQRGTYYTRDRFLIDHASCVIAFYDGKPGGTKYTLDYAAKMGLEIINIANAYRGDPQ